MSAVSHQTIRLARGKHSSPQDGACVMELASMLAGEQFSDHPGAVCPVIGSFLREYNDAIDDARRQDLYAYASAVVGSRGSTEVEEARARRLVEWATRQRERQGFRALLPSSLRRLSLGRTRSLDAAGAHAVRAISRHTDETHSSVLALIEELVAMRGQVDFPDASDTGPTVDSGRNLGSRHALMHGTSSRGALSQYADGCGDSRN